MESYCNLKTMFVFGCPPCSEQELSALPRLSYLFRLGTAREFRAKGTTKHTS